MLPFFYVFYRFGRAVAISLKDPQFKALLSLIVVVLVSGTVFYHFNENWSWLNSLYFSVTTLTTVSFGDLTPHSAGSKIFTIFYLLIGIGILISFITYIAEHSIKEQVGKSFLPWRNGTKNESSAL